MAEAGYSDLARTMRIRPVFEADPAGDKTVRLTGEGLAASAVASFARLAYAALPPRPEPAVAERVTVDFGVARITLLAARTVSFGRSRQLNQVALAPGADATDAELEPYRKVSREHCFFERQGEAVVVRDGHRDGYRVVRPSTCGTYLDSVRLDAPRLLRAGESGVLSFGGPRGDAVLTLSIRVAAPGARCATCALANRGWCDEGAAPSFVLSRRDGRAEHFATVWSCLDLGLAEKALAGSVVFRKEGAFAWRFGAHCGWLVPGTSIETELGSAHVR